MHGTDLLLSCASETQLRLAEIPGLPASPSQLASLGTKSFLTPCVQLVVHLYQRVCALMSICSSWVALLSIYGLT